MATLGATIITGLAAIESNSTTEPPAFNNSAGVTEGTSCRAWVNFNGTGSLGGLQNIRGSFNLTSVLKNPSPGVGNYTVNFANAMIDANYSAIANYTNTNTAQGGNNDGQAICWNYLAGSVNVYVADGSGATQQALYCSVAIFR
jgi:hypothetical protein